MIQRYIIISVLLLFITLSGRSQTAKPLFTAPLGVQTYSFRKSMATDIPGTLDMIQSMGFTEIEGGSGQMKPDEFKKLCDARGLAIPSTGVSYEQLSTDIQGVVEQAKALGAKYVMCAWIPHKSGEFNLQDAAKAADEFNRAGKILKESGLTFCYHIHGYEFQPHGQGTLLDYLITQTNPERVSFEMDIMWAHFGGGDPVALLEKYGDRWKLMHLKDLKAGTKKDLTGLTSPENDVPLGAGELNIPAIIKAAKRVGIRHYFIEDESSQVIKQVPQSIKYLRSLTEEM